LDVDEQLARLLDQQKLAVTETRQYTDEERKIKEQILAQYSQVSAIEETRFSLHCSNFKISRSISALTKTTTNRKVKKLQQAVVVVAAAVRTHCLLRILTL
jgi:hypothetical protein